MASIIVGWRLGMQLLTRVLKMDVVVWHSG
jgi:hypothetical protein